MGLTPLPDACRRNLLDGDCVIGCDISLHSAGTPTISREHTGLLGGKCHTLGQS